jgi:hypothetical protein
MSEFDSTLRMYAQSGLRTAAEWIAVGRSVSSGSPPRAEATHHGIVSALFSRDQTQIQKSTRSRPNPMQL